MKQAGGKHDEALELFDSALELDPYTTDVPIDWARADLTQAWSFFIWSSLVSWELKKAKSEFERAMFSTQELNDLVLRWHYLRTTTTTATKEMGCCFFIVDKFLSSKWIGQHNTNRMVLKLVRLPSIYHIFHLRVFNVSTILMDSCFIPMFSNAL